MKQFIRDQAKRILTRVLRRSGLEIQAIPPPPSAYKGIPDAAYYTSSTSNDPHFSPWELGGYGEFREYLDDMSPFTLVSPDRCHVLYSLGMQSLQTLDGQFFECGVYRGGTAMLLARLVNRRRRFPEVRLHLFDTFEGMPETDRGIDLHRKGDFADMLKRHSGWSVVVLSGHPGLAREMKVKPEIDHRLWNGPLEVRLLRWRIP